MESREFWHLSDVSDTRLRSDLAELLTAGYRTEARIIAHLAEVEQRKIHLKDGSESLYDYCTRVLRLSNSEAFHRITAARIARQFPLVFSLIDQRQLHLTAVCLLRDYLTPENHRELLHEAAHKTKWQVQELLARRFPRPDVESRVRKLPAARPAATPSIDPQCAPSLPAPLPSNLVVQLPEIRTFPAPGTSTPLSRSTPVQTRTPVPTRIEPLSEARYRIQLNASASLKEKLDRLRALTSHSNPSGDIAVLIERALDLALEKVEKQRFAATDRPRATPRVFSQTKLSGQKSERRRAHVPNAVVREIAERDEFRCTYRGTNGRRCTARAFLQVHHELPWAHHGDETVDNLRLLCAAHNQLLAERDFGAKHVEVRRDERGRRAACALDE